MRANLRRFCSGIVGGRFCWKTSKSEDESRKQNSDVSRCVPRRMSLAARALLLLALAVGAALSSRAQSVAVSPAATPNSTSLNGPGNVFLTANEFGSGGTGTLFVAVMDLNGDGKPDYVTANQGNNTIGIALGYGDGYLRRSPAEQTRRFRPWWLARSSKHERWG